ncbi:MAG: transposase [Deltaproteobacteria bacterium]|nr:transposase [Deltaproteobacteria bacterium]
MPRKARIDAPGALHHIICRGIERRNIFRDDTDRNRFVDRLAKLLLETATPCFAWALMPNHFHLLLKTGKEPIAKVMQRLLTGYAVTFNRRHRRYGRLFQNRYKSILCRQDTYLLELVRYIHLNPIRAGIVSDLKTLNKHPFSGHHALMGKVTHQWQDTETVLSLFDHSKRSARKLYGEFVEKGLTQGRRPELTGGGLLRSVGGWGVLKSMREMQIHLKGDERILGDSDFVEEVLDRVSEQMDRRYRLRETGYSFDRLSKRVGQLFGLDAKEIVIPGKQPTRVAARSVLSYWAVHELGLPATEVARKLGLSKSAVSRAVSRGGQIASDNAWSVEE